MLVGASSPAASAGACSAAAPTAGFSRRTLVKCASRASVSFSLWLVTCSHAGHLAPWVMRRHSSYFKSARTLAIHFVTRLWIKE